MSEDQEIERSKARVVEIAQMMLDGRIHLLEGVRKLGSLWFDIEDRENSAFLTIVGIDSETDHLPLGAVRAHWAKSALDIKDQEINAYLERNKDDIFSACKELLDIYGREASRSTPDRGR